MGRSSVVSKPWREKLAEMRYNKAIQRLEEIIAKIENEEIDVDELSASVQEAVELITTCKKRIEKAQMSVKRVVEALGRETEEAKINLRP